MYLFTTLVFIQVVKSVKKFFPFCEHISGGTSSIFCVSHDSRKTQGSVNDVGVESCPLR